MPITCFEVELHHNVCHENFFLKDLYLAIVENIYWIEYKDRSEEVFLYKKRSPFKNEDPLVQGEMVVNQMLQRFTSNPDMAIKPLENRISLSVLAPSTIDEIRYHVESAELKQALSTA